MSATIFVTQGNDFTTNLQLLTDTGLPVNVAGYVFNGIVRQNPYAYANTPLSVVVTDQANGNISINLSAALSANMAYGSYMYIVTSKDPANVTSILMDGDLILAASPLVVQPLPNTGVMLLDDEFFALANQNSFYLSFVPGNANNVIVSVNNETPLTLVSLPLTPSTNTCNISSNILMLANLSSQGDVVQAQEYVD